MEYFKSFVLKLGTLIEVKHLFFQWLIFVKQCLELQKLL